ncbi:MAG: 4a-hydroxytetrahydrobiopterin dehydratase [Pseudomonadota bacterium]
MTLQHWQERNRPARLERRYEFDNYDALRAFLDRAADLSEAKGLYPDIGFGRTHANFTIHADETSAQLTQSQREFAVMLDNLESSGQA